MTDLSAKKNVSVVIRGLVLYLAVLNGTALYNPFFNYSDDFGVNMILAVVIASVTAGIYFSFMNKKYGLFYSDSGSVLNSIFSKKRSLDLKAVFICLVCMMVFQTISAVLGAYIEEMLNAVGLTTALDGSNMNIVESIPILLYVSLIGPFAEELMYRGFIMNGLKSLGRIYAIVVSSLLFGIMHGNLSQIPFAFITGLMLGYIASEYSILASTVMHVINNGGLSLLLKFLQGILPDFVLGLTILAAAAVSIVVFAVIIVKYRAQIKSFLEEDRPIKARAAALLNIWFFIFIAWEGLEVTASLSPV